MKNYNVWVLIGVLFAGLFITNTSYADTNPQFHFTMILADRHDASVEFDDNLDKMQKIILPGVFQQAGWECYRESVILSDDASKYIGRIFCGIKINNQTIINASGVVSCSSSNRDDNTNSFSITTMINGRSHLIAFVLSCRS